MANIGQQTLPPEKTPSPPFSFSNAFIPPVLRRSLDSFSSWRESLGLGNPGLAENLHKEVHQDVFLNNLAFSGMRAVVGRSFSANPLVQVSHSFAAGSSQSPPWGFGVMYGTDDVYMAGNLDSDMNLMSRLNVRINDQNVTKIVTNTSSSQPGGVFQLEHDLTLPSTSLNLKLMNPDFTSQAFQGVVIGSILQSITPRLSLGLETAWQRQAMPGASPTTATPSESTTSFLARLLSKDQSWIAAATLNPGQGVVQATFWKRLGEKVEAGVSLDVKAASSAGGLPGGGGLMVPGPGKGVRVREGTAAFGLKYQFRTANLRAQIDSGGRVTAWLERMLSPQINISFCGDIDHFKGVAKVGLGISVEGTDLPEDQAPSASYIESLEQASHMS